MKQLTKWIKRKIRKEQNIPQRVMQLIASVEKLNTIYRSDIPNKENWNFQTVIDEYIHKNIVWKTGEVNGNGNISPIDKKDAKFRRNVLLQRVFWGENENAYYYGTMSFVKFNRKWYFVTSKIIQPVNRLPQFEECYAQMTDGDGEMRIVSFNKMKELFFEYVEE